MNVKISKFVESYLIKNYNANILGGNGSENYETFNILDADTYDNVKNVDCIDLMKKLESKFGGKFAVTVCQSVKRNYKSTIVKVKLKK